MENNKTSFKCEGGPFDQQRLWLSTGNPWTMEFNLKHFRGQYVQSPMRADILMWMALNK